MFYFDYFFLINMISLFFARVAVIAASFTQCGPNKGILLYFILFYTSP